LSIGEVEIGLAVTEKHGLFPLLTGFVLPRGCPEPEYLNTWYEIL
jgi:hypothetical protein